MLYYVKNKAMNLKSHIIYFFEMHAPLLTSFYYLLLNDTLLMLKDIYFNASDLVI